MADHGGVFREWNKRYLIEYLAALALCLTASGFCIPLARAASSEITRLFFMAVPAAAILVIAIVVFRDFRRVDEMLRRLMVECFAVAGAFAFAWTLAYALFEIAGRPRISMWWVFGGVALAWNLWMLRAVWR